MEEAASRARLEGVEESRQRGRRPPNHRDVNVGCAVMAIDAEATEWGIFAGRNTKPTGDAGKVCAETRSIRKAQKAGFLWIVGAVIVGDPKVDDGTGYEPATMWSCEVCRPEHLDEDMEHDTLIATIMPSKPRAQIQTASEMIGFMDAYMRGEEPDEPDIFPYRGASRWEAARQRYTALVPAGFDTLASPANRATAVEAARVAIAGLTRVK